jgi:hypothetical protein
MAESKFNAMSLMKEMTIIVRVERMNELKIRMWLALKLMRLAALIGNMGFQVDMEDENG